MSLIVMVFLRSGCNADGASLSRGGLIMDVTRAIDLYCERTGAGLWAEPANLVTNAAFLVASGLAYRKARGLNVSRGQSAWLLIFLLASIGVGSGLFHSFATVWAQAMDVLPIGLYILAMLTFWLREAHQYGARQCAGAIGGVLLLSVLFGVLVPPQSVNGSQGYFGVLVFMVWLATKQHKSKAPGREFLGAALLFALSLAFRIVDPWWCSAWPLGTHFMWHLCNAGVCYLPLHAYIRLQRQGA